MEEDERREAAIASSPCSNPKFKPSSAVSQARLSKFQVMQGLAESIAWDGEGAPCLIEVTVKGSGSESESTIYEKWDLLLRDYNEAKGYSEDIKHICDDFEGLCQRNLATNTVWM